MSVSLNPISHWVVLGVASLAVMILTVWAYLHRLKGTTGRWRWFAIGLRLAAVLLCFVAALRPSVVLQEKKKQDASLVFLVDTSESGKIADEVSGQKRFAAMLKVLNKALAVARTLGSDMDVKLYAFDSTVREIKAEDLKEPTGRESAYGNAMLEPPKRQTGRRVASMVVLGDGANNSGIAPLTAAESLKSLGIPVVTVGFGSENAGANSRDIIVRDLVAPSSAFVKNQFEVKGTLVARGFPNQAVDVEMLVEDQEKPVATKRVTIPQGAEVIPLSGLKYIPQTAGEKKITLRVKPEKGELILTNNEISSFVTVMKGGLSVLFLQGPNFTWEFKYLSLAVGTSPDIQVELRVLRKPAQGEVGEIKDDEFAPGKHDAYILSDMPASFLTKKQQKLLADVVEQGAGLLMLGGRASFGPGGWAGTEVARVLPVNIHPGDGQLEPEGGIQFVPQPDALDNYVLQIGRDRAESAAMWKQLPPLPGTNRFGTPKPLAVILGATGGAEPEPIMVSMEVGNKGRVLAFGGETWVWSRASDVGRSAHKKFWRQAIFWLSHKEDQGENQVKVKLATRRISVGSKLDMTATARDPKGLPVPDVKWEMSVTMEGSSEKPVPVDAYPQADEVRGSYVAMGKPGTYKVNVKATRKGETIGTDSVRFLVYQDDREMENPAADRALLRSIAQITGGESLAPEDLEKYLKSLSGKIVSEYVTQQEYKVWDNWPFLLIFALLLTLEWWLRKRHGWV